MIAARVHQFGEFDVIRIEDAPVPEPKPDQVLIRMRAASVNPIDWKYVVGRLPTYGSLPFTLGWDGAGDVVAVGADVTDLNVGDAVYAVVMGGSYAQYAAVSGAQTARKPASLDYVQAAAMPVVAQSAWQALFRYGKLTSGQRVLIHAASGGVGHLAVQIAKWAGAYVIGSASGRNEAFVRSLGADEFINYETTRFEDVVSDLDLVLDGVGGENLRRSYTVLRPGGIAVAVTTAGEINDDEAKAHGVEVARLRRSANRAELDELARLVDAGFVKPTVSAVYPLADISLAFESVRTGHTRGKVVLTIP
ncbi:MAG: NADP-dependent oxidoreductase [Anaerolineae bacterium]|nr:NADP-dependent oxidoreductase [Anaerolineae bacterium]